MKTKATATKGTKTSTTAKATLKKKLSVMEKAIKYIPDGKYAGLEKMLEPHEIRKPKTK